MRPELSFVFSHCSPCLSRPAPSRLSLVVSHDEDDVITSAPPLSQVAREVVIVDEEEEAAS